MLHCSECLVKASSWLEEEDQSVTFKGQQAVAVIKSIDSFLHKVINE